MTASMTETKYAVFLQLATRSAEIQLGELAVGGVIQTETERTFTESY